jgi:hypothetical protein
MKVVLSAIRVHREEPQLQLQFPTLYGLVYTEMMLLKETQFN